MIEFSDQLNVLKIRAIAQVQIIRAANLRESNEEPLEKLQHSDSLPSNNFQIKTTIKKRVKSWFEIFWV